MTDKRKSDHPMQPIETDEHGVERFKSNQIIVDLFNDGALDLNRISTRGYTDEDQTQIAQLLGYSVSGFGDLSYALDEHVQKADEHVLCSCHGVQGAV